MRQKTEATLDFFQNGEYIIRIFFPQIEADMTTSAKKHFDPHDGMISSVPFLVAVSAICISMYGAIFSFTI